MEPNSNSLNDLKRPFIITNCRRELGGKRLWEMKWNWDAVKRYFWIAEKQVGDFALRIPFGKDFSTPSGALMIQAPGKELYLVYGSRKSASSAKNGQKLLMSRYVERRCAEEMNDRKGVTAWNLGHILDHFDFWIQFWCCFESTLTSQETRGPFFINHHSSSQF